MRDCKNLTWESGEGGNLAKVLEQEKGMIW